MKDVEKLEKVQKFALRLCVKQWDLDYVSLLFICDLPYTRCSPKILQPLYNVQDCKSTDLLSFTCFLPESLLSSHLQTIFTISYFVGQTHIYTHLFQTLVLSGIRCLFL